MNIFLLKVYTVCCTGVLTVLYHGQNSVPNSTEVLQYKYHRIGALLLPVVSRVPILIQ